MKTAIKKATLLFIAATLSAGYATAQTDASSITPYHRSSLFILPVIHMQDSFATELVTAVRSMPFPDRYDKIADANDVIYQENDHCNYSIIKDKNAHCKWDSIMAQSSMAKVLIANWFNMQDDGSCNTVKLAQRSQYDASEVTKALAAQTAEGHALLTDVGDELIGKTFVLVNDMSYVSHADRAAVVSMWTETIKQAAQATQEVGNAVSGLGGIGSTIGGIMSLAGGIAEMGADLTSAGNDFISAEGFVVMQNTHLYQLEWNDSIANIFYSNYYSETPDEAKRAAFMADNTSFNLKYIGSYTELTNKMTSGTFKVLSGANSFANKSAEEQIIITCTRTQDAAINSLQKKFDVFKVNTPITELVYDKKGKVTGIIAPIGLKEGVTKKSKFNVLEMTMKNGRTVYEQVCTISPDSKAGIWDNRYMADEENGTVQTETMETEGTRGTTFNIKNASRIYKGMLIREKK